MKGQQEVDPFAALFTIAEIQTRTEQYRQQGQAGVEAGSKNQRRVTGKDQDRRQTITVQSTGKVQGRRQRFTDNSPGNNQISVHRITLQIDPLPVDPSLHIPIYTLILIRLFCPLSADFFEGRLYGLVNVWVL